MDIIVDKLTYQYLPFHMFVNNYHGITELLINSWVIYNLLL